MKSFIGFIFSIFIFNVNAQQYVSTVTADTLDLDTQIFNWFKNQQLANGLLESAENSNIVSLYDNALAAMLFLLIDEDTSAEKIFNYFNKRIEIELKAGVGGFFQFRDRYGKLVGFPSNKRWMGDNAWLLIALNNYKEKTGKTTYSNLANTLDLWLQSLQDNDGGLFAGYAIDDKLMRYKVTEGNIDAFNAVAGYTSFHKDLLSFLHTKRWDSTSKNLVATRSNQKYMRALDLHSWPYLIFQNYPESALISTSLYLNTQTTFMGKTVSGYCFDEDIDTVWFEGSGQVALAFALAGMINKKNNVLKQMENAFIPSTIYLASIGLPYVSNPGSMYGETPLWKGANTSIAISGSVWYVFAKYGFNPFGLGRLKPISRSDMFWLD